MARIIPVGFGEAAMVIVGNSLAPFVTTLGVSLTGVTPADYADAADAIFDAFDTRIMPFVASAYQLERVDLRVGLAGGTSGTVTSTLPPAAGGRSSASAVFGLSPVVQKLSATLGRSGRGRAFLPAVLGRDDVDNSGGLNPAVQAALQGAYSGFLTDLATFPVGDALAPVILHAEEQTPTPITQVRVANQAGYIRTRMPKA